MMRAAGLALSVGYAAVIVWLYASQPQTMAQVTGGLAAGIGAYRIDDQAFSDGLAFFRKDQFDEARAAFERADPAQRDARTQFYIAYTFYRQGWGRVYNDDQLFRQGVEAVDRAIALAPEGRVIVDNPRGEMRSPEELRADPKRGMRGEANALTPLRFFDRRK